MILNIFLLIAVGVIFVRCICVVSKLNRRSWHGHQIEFAGLSLSYAFLAGGAIGIPLGWMPAPIILLFGLAGMVIFDRRNRT